MSFWTLRNSILVFYEWSCRCILADLILSYIQKFSTFLNYSLPVDIRFCWNTFQPKELNKGLNGKKSLIQLDFCRKTKMTRCNMSHYIHGFIFVFRFESIWYFIHLCTSPHHFSDFNGFLCSFVLKRNNKLLSYLFHKESDFWSK